MPTILDFQIQPLSAESYSLAVCERSSPQPLASATFSHRVDFLTDFSVDRLNASNKDPGERFDELQKLGRELYQKLFPPAVAHVWREYKQRSEFLILCLRFAEKAAKLEVLPWETLHDGAEFIAAGAKTTLMRLPLDVAPQSELPPIPRPLRLFGFFASPLDLQDHERLNAEREQEILLEAINDPAGEGRISADFEDEAKLEILDRSLRAESAQSGGYHILHFTGHGINPRDGGGLLLEDAHGKKLPASIADVMQAVKSGVDKLRLAVISGCQTARTLHTGAFSDLARELLRQRVPAVIAMQFSITDEGGLKFAEVLYREIAKGVELERAVHAARRVLLEDKQFFINNDALAIVLLAADGACLQTTEAQAAPPQAEPGATYLGDRLDPLAHGFYGRRREYRKLRDALLHQDQRAVIIHGIGGIGKTALLSHAINRLRPRFKDVMSFDCRRAALAPETILLGLHRYFATQGMPQLQPLIGQNVPPETLADEIAKLLTELPLLIVFDNFESQLDEQREIANVDLRVFLTTLVRATATSSRFLFTTRYLFDLDSKQLGNVQELPLGDLSRPEALMLMQKLPNLAQAAYRHKLAVLEKFGGHPYALVTLDRYCSHQSLDQALLDASSLTAELREFLAIELNYRRLSDRARELLNRLAAFRQAVPFAAAEWVTGEKQALDVSEPIRELIDWGLLIPHHEDGVSQTVSVHSLVRDFCQDRQGDENWRVRLREAAAYYTNSTKLMSDESKSPTFVWSEMEASELLMEAEDFSEATGLLSDAHPLLDRWGFSPYLEGRYYRLLDKVDREDEGVVRLNLGILLQARGDYDAALAHYQASLKIDEELGDVDSAAHSLHQIGGLYQDRGEYDVALDYYQRSLKIAEEIDDEAGVAGSLHNIGILHQARGSYDDALDHYRRALKLFEELGDEASASQSLHQIGNLHYLRGSYDAALDHYQRSLKIAQELDDVAGIAHSLHQVGRLHQTRGSYDDALDHYQQSLKIREELGNADGIARLLHNIGTLHQTHGNYDDALNHYQQALKIKEDLGDVAGVASSLHQIGMLHQDCGNLDAALDHHQRALKIAEGLGDLAVVAVSLHEIGRLYQTRGDLDTALEHYQRSLRIKEELGNVAGFAISQAQIGRLMAEIEQYQKAMPMLLSALSIFSELQSPNAQIVADMLRILRGRWGEREFDAAWQEATNEETPEWLMDEMEATAS